MKTCLPAISRRVIPRPMCQVAHFLPDLLEHTSFWEDFYINLREHLFVEPVEVMSSCIDPYTGYFGLRWHPMKRHPSYFHAGIDVNVPEGSEVVATGDGIFAYSGYHGVNGCYILLSHPDLCTADGFVFHSFYMHLSSSFIRFSFPEKLMRKCSGDRFPCKRVTRGMRIALSGDTGIAKGYPHLHFQLEFRHEGKAVLIDPCRVLGIPSRENLTAFVRTEAEFEEIVDKRKELAFWRRIL